MKTLPKKVDFLEIEERWEHLWQEHGTYRYDWDDEVRPKFSVDTPPPYPSGEFHMGNVLNWTYFDMVARYKRMRGHNVHFPQGWDCHGLPTEVAVEKARRIRRSEVPPGEFRRLCEEWIEQYIATMKRAVIRLGCSGDWNLEYRTMEPAYMRKIQLSFLMLYDRDMIYKGEHPINWCPRCETAIADAEVEREHCVGRLYTVAFGLEGGEELLIATSRPEYIPACVAVGINPDDERHRHLIGGNAVIPIVGRTVPIIADDAVDPKFGTGAMMICTYGDKADVTAVARYGLPTIRLVDEKGRMTEAGGAYRGLGVEEAKKRIVADLDRMGLLRKTEDLDQEVGTCWRCDTPIEILTTEQWFMRTQSLTDDVEKAAMAIRWYPDWMRYRLIDWARSLDWDWVLSRQRVFATPIPAWHCRRCGAIRMATPGELPVDPKTTLPRGACPSCGSTDFRPETDVLDTWFDSSLTCAIHAGWPDRPDWRKLFPASIHPSGQDIIRTWAYYLMVRHLALFGETAYDSVLINGMVLGNDGRKMSKSLGNFVASPEVFGKYGADAARQWAAAGGNTGFDVPFRWSDVEYGWRFMRKLWNACSFASAQLRDYDPEAEAEPEILDRWLLSVLERVVKATTDAFEECQFMNAFETARNFVWHVFCDHYLEAVKHRLYGGGEGQMAAQRTLHYAVKRILKLLAPVMPHVTEEIYSQIYAIDDVDSIHLSDWPVSDATMIDELAERRGDLIIAVIRDVRKEKNRLGIPLNTSISGLTVFAAGDEEAETLELGRRDISATVKAEAVELRRGTGGDCEVDGYPGVRFTVSSGTVGI
jgi:valyl-tRNA synthetase